MSSRQHLPPGAVAGTASAIIQVTPHPKPPRKKQKPRGPYDLCPGCTGWKAVHAKLCRTCSTSAHRTENPVLPQPCSVCSTLTTATSGLRHGRCDKCRSYWNRHGEERPTVDRVPPKPKPPKPCVTCGKLSKQLRRGVCHSCDPSARRGDAIAGMTLTAKGERACRLCGATFNLHLHHAIPRGKWKAGRADLRNGIPLCATCHFGWHNKTIVVPRSVFRPDEWAFMLTADIGKNIDYWLDQNYPDTAGAP